MSRPSDRKPPRNKPATWTRRHRKLCWEKFEERTLLSSFLVSNLNDSGAGSLRAEINAANVDPISNGLDTVSFPSSVPPGTISLLSQLPSLTRDDVWILGDPFSPITLNGNSAGGGSDGLVVSGNQDVVEYLNITEFGGAGLTINGDDSSIDENTITHNGGDGIDFGVGAQGNIIGGYIETDEHNVISANGGNGIVLYGPGTEYNLIQGNFIGTDSSGTEAMGNAGCGVLIYGGASNNSVGYSLDGNPNVISANGEDGVATTGSGTTGNLVQGNLIGTDITGSAPLGNALRGVLIYGGASDNTIGGTLSGTVNVISANGEDGVGIADGGSDGNVVLGNYLGTDISGNNPLGNGWRGVVIWNNAQGNTVGGMATGAGNIIADNGTGGVWITGATDNVVQGDTIGLNLGGTTALGNLWAGIQIDSDSDGNTVGGATVAVRNVISGNVGDGVLIESGATGNLIEGNFIGTNCDGSAGLSNAYNGVNIDGAPENTIGGTAAGERNVISGNGISGILIDNGATGTVVQGNYIGTDDSGTIALGNTYDGINITTPGNTIGGTESGAGNLIAGNDRVGVYLYGPSATDNLVQGNLIGTNASGEGPLGNANHGVLVQDGAADNTIGGTSAGAGNVISDNGSSAALSGVDITDPGSTGNLVQGNMIGTDAEGTKALGNAGDGVDVYSAGNTIENNLISGNGQEGIDVVGLNAGNNLIEGNMIGTGLSGGTAVANGLWGVFLYDTGDNTIGGSASGAGNLISGNSQGGVAVRGIDSTGDVIQGNMIGVDSSGSHPLGNGLSGIYVGDWGVSGDAAADAIIMDNVISDNGNYGVLLSGAGTSGIVVQGNKIGTTADGSSALGNAEDGIYLDGVSDSTIGGTASGDANVISGNGADGVDIGSSSENLIVGNSIGTDANGTDSLANQADGVFVADATGNTIGGTASGAGNIISGNGGDGVDMDGATDTCIAGNHIGTTPLGFFAMPNTGAGIVTGGGSENTIGGTTAAAGNVISGNVGDGVDIGDSSLDLDGDTQDTVAANYIGVDASGSVALPNAGNGVSTYGGSGNTIGGTIASAANVISGNNEAGIDIVDDDELVAGNLIGCNHTGIQPLGNGGDGIDVSGDNNTIGGTTDGAANIIGANGGSGVLLDGASSNLVVGNSIGTDSSGNIPMGNGHGVEIVDGASNNTIGGTTPAARNIISGSTSDDGDGVLISDEDTTGNVVQGNYIGTGEDGTSTLGNQADGVAVLDATGNAIGGTSSGAGNLISANGADGVDLDGATNTLVAGNFIGTNGDGNGALGNAKGGVVIQDASTGNTIGGMTSDALNVVSGNSGDGVDIEGSGTSQNLVAGNYIGTDITGSRPVPNRGNGVSLVDQASDNTVGGGAGDGSNVISANNLVGVIMSGAGTDENVAAGNLIGTDVHGSFALGNSSGVNVVDGASDNTIGGDTADAGNVISASTSAAGVLLSGSTTTDNLVAGNNIGTDITGGLYLRNATDGITVLDASANTIGGTAAAAGNIISANSASGVDLDGASDNLVEGNDIGTNDGGTADLGNSQAGITVQNEASDNTIGGTFAGAANTIAFNGGNGITVGQSAVDISTGDSILENAIYSNARLGIDLSNDGVTLNGSAGHSGPNLFQDFPVLTSAITSVETAEITRRALSESEYELSRRVL